MCHKSKLNQTKPNEKKKKLWFYLFFLSLFQASEHFLHTHKKKLRSKGGIETKFKDLLASKPLEFYRKDINNLVVIDSKNE